MSSPYDQQQPPYQPQPYGSQPYGYSGWPAQPPAGPPRRPGTLITAGVLWVLNGAVLLLIGIAGLVANQLPGIEEVYADNPDVTPELVQTFGIVTTAFAVVLIGLGIVVFSGATWARVLITVLAAPVAILGFALVIVPLLTIAAVVLQFLPPSNAYAAARRRSA